MLRSPKILGIALLGFSFSLSCIISLLTAGIANNEDGPSTIGTLLSVGRVGMSDYFYGLADTSFHRGVEHTHKEVIEKTLFQKAAEELSPTKHAHLGGAQVKEIMPWLWLALRTDPKNAELCLVTSFWLSSAIARNDLALQVLQEGQLNNPFCYEIQLEKGRLLLSMLRLTSAEEAFNAALAFWPGSNNPEDFRVRNDKMRILLYMSLLHESRGEAALAIRRLKEILELFPKDANIRTRLRDLEQGKQPSLRAALLLERLTKEHEAVAPEHECPRVTGDPRHKE